MAREFNRKIVLEDGTEYFGYGFGDTGDRVSEIVFNTSMVGYQEVVFDPAYADCAVVMTYPLIGNYGITDEDFSTKGPCLDALIVGEYNDHPSNFSYTKTLAELMEENHVVGIEGLDTRRLARHIRDNGTCRCIITDIATDKKDALAKIAATPVATDAVSRVSCRKPRYARTPEHAYNVVVVDCGVRSNVIHALNARGCNVVVVPCDTSAEDILALRPNGLLVSGGPGNPADACCVIDLVRTLRGKLPIAGIGLGHAIIALAYGGKTVKLKFGHRGGNHPVRCVADGKVDIVSQNHTYAVEEASLAPAGLTLTHQNVLDGTVEGFSVPADRVYAVAFQHESAPGHRNPFYLYEKLIAEMSEVKNNAKKN